MTTTRQIGRLLGRARPAAGLLIVSVAARTLGLIAGAGLLLAPAWALGLLVQGVPDPHALVRVSVLTMLVCAVGKGGLRYLEQLTGHIAAFRLLTRMRLDLHDELVPLAPAITETQGSGVLMSAATKDIDRLEVFYAHTIAPVITAVLLPLAAVAAATTWAGPTAGGILAAGVLLGGLLVPLSGARQGRRAAERIATARTRLAQEISDDVRGHEEIRIFQATEQRTACAETLSAEVADSVSSTGRLLGRRAAVTVLWPWATVLTLLALVPAPLPELLATIALVPATAPALASVEAFSRSLPAALASDRRLRALTDTPPAVTEPADPVPLGDPAGRLDLTGVTFTYPSRTAPAVQAIDLHAPAGSLVAVVGVTGSGKSTLTRLLTRTWDPDAGTVRLDGVDVRELALADLRRQVAVVEQRPVLLSGTIGENLRLVRPRATHPEVRAACAAAGLDQDLDTFPEGLSTHLGEDGLRLSGGQAQRLALARALLRRAPVLVLDEATSHQDALSQALITHRLREAAAGTVLVIAHRLATIRHADRIYVLEEGRVVESGSYPELIGAHGAFRRLAGSAVLD